MDRRGERAFTLIEIMVVIAITGIIIAAIYNTYFSGWQVWSFNQDRVIFQQVQRVIVARISPFIREATYIDTAPPDSDRLRIFFSKKSPTSDPADDYDGLGYGLNDNKQFYYRKHHPTTGWGSRISMISLKATSLSFAKSPDNENELIMNMTLVSEDGEREYAFSESFYPRLSGAVITP